jgi:beta-1,4-mannosyl-glycoprotein beta-1,4-N-acetylglucosaminyltransferase
MIIDGFTFFNELDLLEIRLEILDSYVDKFILVEAERTHSNKPKELYYEKNKERYSKFHDKIIHLVVTEDMFRAYGSMTTTMDCMFNENFQRDYIQHAWNDFSDDDIVMVSDLDEIPNMESIQPETITTPVSFSQKVFYNYVNTTTISGTIWHNCTVACKKGSSFSPQRLRDMRDSIPSIPNGGWHFSYMGGPQKVEEKIKGFLHQEFNHEQVTNQRNIEERQKSLQDPLGRPQFKLELLENLDILPSYLVDNRKKYNHLFLDW